MHERLFVISKQMKLELRFAHAEDLIPKLRSSVFRNPTTHKHKHYLECTWELCRLGAEFVWNFVQNIQKHYGISFESNFNYIYTYNTINSLIIVFLERTWKGGMSSSDIADLDERIFYGLNWWMKIKFVYMSRMSVRSV